MESDRFGFRLLPATRELDDRGRLHVASELLSSHLEKCSYRLLGGLAKRNGAWKLPNWALEAGA